MSARQSATRALCVLVAIGWVLKWAMVLCVGVILFRAYDRGTVDQFLFFPVFSLCIAWLLTIVAYLWLQIWRRCDRCGRGLFSLNASFNRDRTGIPDYRAKQFLGSFEKGAVLQMARTGSMNCLCCGHTDGANLDYVVRRQQ